MDDSLKALKPLHLPESVSWWPPAPGWWILLGLICLVVLFWGYRRYRLRLQYAALAELDELQAESLEFSDLVNRANLLLKRYALVCFPREKVAGLSGQQWQKFLKETGDERLFKRMDKLLLEAPYQRNAKRRDQQALFDFCQHWIKKNKPVRQR